MSTRAILISTLFLSALLAFADSDPPVPYPTEYRKWAVTRSFIAKPGGNSGFHHYYANPEAMKGFTTGAFPEGSVIVDERLEVDQSRGLQEEGARITVSVMKDSQRYAATGGWGFDVAKGDSTTPDGSPAVRASCYSCHVKQKEHDFVFTSFRK